MTRKKHGIWQIVCDVWLKWMDKAQKLGIVSLILPWGTVYCYLLISFVTSAWIMLHRKQSRIKWLTPVGGTRRIRTSKTNTSCLKITTQRTTQNHIKLIKGKRLTTPIFTHFEIQASWRYFSVLSLSGLKDMTLFYQKLYLCHQKLHLRAFKENFWI